MSRSALAPVFNTEGAFNDAVIALGRGANEREAIQHIDRVLYRYGNLSAYGRADHTSARIVSAHIDEIRTSGVIFCRPMPCW